MALHHRGFPIRKSAGQRIFPPYRSLSQVIASFFGSQCQGIHLTLFFAWTAFRSPFKNLILFWEFSAFYCLSFANNCFLGCKLKDLFVFIIHWFVRPDVLPSELTKLFFPTSFVRKNLLLNISITSFSQYTTICFVSFFFIRFSMNICVTFFVKKGNQRNFILEFLVCILNSAFCILHFKTQRVLTGRPKWTRTTDLVLIRHAL